VIYQFLLASILLLTVSESFAEKMSVELEPTQQYSERLVPGVGLVIFDNVKKLEYTKCLVGMDSSTDKPNCIVEDGNRPMELDWDQAMQAAKKAGGGWRLPNANEIVYYAKTNTFFHSFLDRYRRLHLWTSSSIRDTSDAERAAFLFEDAYVEDTMIYTSRERFSKYPFILVRVRQK
jgi:hypothetical protein